MIGSYPWYISDWRQDEKVLALTMEQQGIYHNLLDMCWDGGDLPTDEGTLRKLALCSEREWKRSWPAVKPFFVEIDGRLHNPKVDENRPRLLESKESRRKAGEARAAQAGRKGGRFAPAHPPAHHQQDAPAEQPAEHQQNTSTETSGAGSSPPADAPAEHQPFTSTSTSTYSGGEKGSRVVTPPPPRNGHAERKPKPPNLPDAEIEVARNALRSYVREIGRLEYPPEEPDPALAESVLRCFGGSLDALGNWLRRLADKRKKPGENPWGWFLTLAQSAANGGPV